MLQTATPLRRTPYTRTTPTNILSLGRRLQIFIIFTQSLIIDKYNMDPVVRYLEKIN